MWPEIEATTLGEKLNIGGAEKMFNFGKLLVRKLMNLGVGTILA